MPWEILGIMRGRFSIVYRKKIIISLWRKEMAEAVFSFKRAEEGTLTECF